MPVENGRYLASQIPGVKYIEYPDGEHGSFIMDSDFQRTLCGDIEEFVTGHRESALPDLERVLATVLFTDIVDFDDSVLPKWEITHGVVCSMSMIGPHSGLSKNTGGTWSKQRVTGYSRRSTDLDADSCALALELPATFNWFAVRAPSHRRS